MRPSRLSIGALALAIALAAPSFAATLVNGSFEPAAPSFTYQALPGGSSAIPGWVTTDTGVEWFAPTPYGVGAAAAGTYCVDIANYVYSAGGIQQTLATTPGVTYTVGFFLGTSGGAGRDGTCQIVVDADGQSQAFNATNTGGTIAWFAKSFAWTADGASATLRFRCLQNANQHFADIDGATLTDSTTPTASSSWGRIKSLFR